MDDPEFFTYDKAIGPFVNVYDFEIAYSVSGIRCVLDQINRNRYELVNVLPYDRDGYIIFFRRPVNG